MDLNDFGTDSISVHRRHHRRDGIGTDENKPWTLTQWAVSKRGIYRACGTTQRQLLPGAYECSFGPCLESQLTAKDLRVDDLLDFAGSLPAQILQEVDAFWTLGKNFSQHGYLHRRGYFLYGPQGSGKSSVVHQVVSRIVQAGHVAIFCTEPFAFCRTMEVFRRIEPDRPVLCVFEDIDAIIEEYGDTELLHWLDGAQQIDKVINLATSNYPERLDRRIICRPRRFDRIIKIEPPSAELRRAYFARKLPDLRPEELERWVKSTSGLSFASLAELVISVACLGNSLEETLRTLRTIEEKQPTSKECEKRRNIGFGAAREEEVTRGL